MSWAQRSVTGQAVTGESNKYSTLTSLNAKYVKKQCVHRRLYY
jgi:hypothetical protein